MKRLIALTLALVMAAAMFVGIIVWQITKSTVIKKQYGEIKKAKEIAAGNGLVGVNIMTAVTHYKETCLCAVRAGADAIISGAGLPLKLAEYVKGSDTLFAPGSSGFLRWKESCSQPQKQHMSCGSAMVYAPQQSHFLSINIPH